MGEVDRPTLLAQAESTEVVMSRSRTIVLSATVLAVVAACGGSEKKATSPTSTTTLSSAAPSIRSVSPSIAASDDIAKKCDLHVGDVEQAPKFDFDDSELLPRDRDTLAQISQSLTTGPLKERTVKPIGRADPRGTVDNNSRSARGAPTASPRAPRSRRRAPT